MMTYGWAILIIVIVAVILYSMGIFNPSSSITFTSSGFSPFTISSVICSQDGLSFSVLAGPMPNGAYSMSINSFYIVSSSGTNTSRISYTLSSPITLTSGKTGVIAVPNVVCPSAGTKVSMSANLEYSYSTTAGKVVTNTTGTLAGTATHGPTLPAGIAYYSQLTVSNSQSTATPSPFQQMVNFTSSDPGWTSISTNNFGQNVEFFYYNGTVIPSWLENYTSSHALWWVKVGSIPASSSITIYMGFASSSTNFFNTNDVGEAPQLSSTYAEYDDGVNIFDIYFNGNAPISDFTSPVTGSITQTTSTFSNGNTVKVLNFTVTTPYAEASNDAFIYVASSIINAPDYYIGEASFASDGTNQPFSVVGLGENSGNGLSDNVITSMTQWNNAYFGQSYVLNGALYGSLNLQGITTATWRYSSLTYSSSSGYSSYIAPQLYSTIGGYSGTIGANPISSITPLYFVIYPDTSVGSDSTRILMINWARVRAYPPNGVMPSVSFGSVS
jgi:hypothetical protein